MGVVQIGWPVTVQLARGRVWATCWVKRAWADAWTYVPYLEPVQASEAVSPSTSSAVLRYHFGTVKREDASASAVYSPVQLQGWYVSIWGHSQYGTWPVWIGVIGPQGTELHGVTSTGLPQGTQTLQAVGLEWLLDRRVIDRAYVEGGSVSIDRTPVFNRRYQWGMSPSGNRTTSANGSGVHTFSDDGADWDHLQIAEYLLHYFINAEPWGVDFYLAGDAWVLAQRVTQLDVSHGPTVRQALDKIIARERGLGWKVVTTGAPGAPVWIYVFSVTAQAMQLGDVLLPANRNPVWVRFDDAKDIDVSMTFNPVNQFDSVIARGAPAKVVTTVSFAGGSLTRAWSAAEEAAYLAATDAQRSADQYQHVFTRFRVPSGFSMSGAMPTVRYDGVVSPSVDSGRAWQQGKRFMDVLPFEEGADSNGEPSYRRPFVVASSAGTYYLLHSVPPGTIENGQCALEVYDRELALTIQGVRNHVLAKNHWDGATASAVEPVWDWEDLAATVFFETDTRLQVRLPIWSGVFSETARTLVVDDTSAEYWYATPNTIKDVQSGSLVYYGGAPSTYQVIRDDSDRLRALAVFMAAWYGQMRATMDLAVAGLTPAVPAGVLIVAAGSGLAAERVGTVVTERVWDFDGQRTFIRTGYMELDVGG